MKSQGRRGHYNVAKVWHWLWRVILIYSKIYINTVPIVYREAGKSQDMSNGFCYSFIAERSWRGYIYGTAIHILIQNLEKALYNFWLTRTKNVSCFYHNGESTFIIAIFVDDFLILYKNDKQREKLKSYLHGKFNMKYVVLARNCIGITTSRHDFIKLDQSKYFQRIREKFVMLDWKKKSHRQIWWMKKTH